MHFTKFFAMWSPLDTLLFQRSPLDTLFFQWSPLDTLLFQWSPLDTLLFQWSPLDTFCTALSTVDFRNVGSSSSLGWPLFALHSLAVRVFSDYLPVPKLDQLHTKSARY